MLLKAAAILILLHGLIHLIGVVTFWKLGLREQYSTKILSGVADIGENGTYVLGFAWLVVTVAYTVAAVGMFTDQSGLAAVTVASLVLTVLGWKDTVFGTAINVAILAALVIA